MAPESKLLISGLGSPTKTEYGRDNARPVLSDCTTEPGAAKNSPPAGSLLAEQVNTEVKADSGSDGVRGVVRASKHAPVFPSKDDLDPADQVRQLKQENSKLKKRAIKGEARVSVHEKTNNGLRSAFEASQMKGSEMESELQQLRQQLASVDKENGELTSRLLKLQPVDVVSDAQINDTYKTLCAEIVDWVDTHLGDTNNVVDCLKFAAQDEQYGAMVMEFVDGGLWASMQAHKGAQSCFLNCLVQRFIMCHILNRYASCVPADMSKSLRVIEEQMQSSHLDAAKISSWRADGIRALHNTAAVRQFRDRRLAATTSAAAFLLGPLFSQPGDHTKAIQDFREHIIDEAFKLNQQIRTSPVEYFFDLRYVCGTETWPSPLRQGYTTSSVLVDAENGVKIRRCDELIYDANGCFGQALCVVFPGLMRKASHGQSIRIGKPTILAMLNKEQQPASIRDLLMNYLTR